jgi:hypothetical protein
VPEFTTLSGGHPYGQRIDAFGRTRWGDAGIELTPGETLRLANFGLVGDGAGGAILSWMVSVPQYANDLRDIRLQRFDGDGVSRWGAGGLQIREVQATDFGSRDLRLVADGAGGVATIYMQPFGASSPYSELRTRAVDAAGQTRWTTDLELRDRYDANVAAVARTVGGDLMIAWTDSGTVQRAQRLDPAGAPRWAQSGIELARTTRIPTHNYDDFYSLALVDDGADGAIASWYEQHSASSCPQCAMLRHVVALDAEGRPRWGAAGVPVPNAGNSNIALAADRSLGAWFAWGDSANLRSTRLQHVDASGAPLLGARGIEPGLPTSTQPNPAIAPDGAGGVFVSWEDQPDRMHAQVHTQHFAADGTRLWAADATSDRALAPGTTGSGLALESVWPNPSQGHWQAVISLADGSPVTLDLVDIAGRLVHRATVTGLLPGRQSIAFDRPAGLRPGLYLLRVTQGGHATSRKVAFVP